MVHLWVVCIESLLRQANKSGDEHLVVFQTIKDGLDIFLTQNTLDYTLVLNLIIVGITI